MTRTRGDTKLTHQVMVRFSEKDIAAMEAFGGLSLSDMVRICVRHTLHMLTDEEMKKMAFLKALPLFALRACAERKKFRAFFRETKRKGTILD